MIRKTDLLLDEKYNCKQALRSMVEEVIELSIKETNELRASLGLKPLQTGIKMAEGNDGFESDNTRTTTIASHENAIQNHNVDELNLSVEESNDLRARLGLKPLNVSSPPKGNDGRKASQAIHAPAQNTKEKDAITKRIELAKLNREVEAGIMKIRNESGLSLGEKADTVDDGVFSWADQMRKRSSINDHVPAITQQKLSKGKDALKKYSDSDFADQNLTVSHAMADFDAGATTVLTLADKSILDVEEDNEHTLENVNLSESTVLRDNLKRKRMMEMGVGHAGGYAGYDDDEFEELGGSQITLGSKGMINVGKRKDIEQKTGFKLGAAMEAADDVEEENSLFASMSGKSISLVSANNEGVHQADFLSYEEDETISLRIGSMNKEQIEKRRKKKAKKLKKHRKKEIKSRDNNDKLSGSNNKEACDETKSVKPLLEDLLSDASKKKRRKRQRRKQHESDNENSDTETSQVVAMDKYSDNTQKKEENNGDKMQDRRENPIVDIIEKNEQNEVDDDAFLCAALSKARRLRRLKDLSSKMKSNSAGSEVDAKGADAVVRALNRSKQESHENNATNDGNVGRKITFELGTTSEFTRALLARPSSEKKTGESHVQSNLITGKDIQSVISNGERKDVSATIDSYGNENVETLEDLAVHMKEDQDDLGAFGSTGSTVGVGRGLSAVLDMLKHTGEISGKTGGKEEMRGRAKDERTYEDYKPLNLDKVVKIDTTGINGAPHHKDIELAKREVKLEYRDEHGRLLTRKEAYRQLCYQFHGHGSSKKKEEKRLQQIEREQAERSASSRSLTGTLGAQKATQKATGKAFVVRRS